jgi:tetratricopeptide (TPR) repeat protein
MKRYRRSNLFPVVVLVGLLAGAVSSLAAEKSELAFEQAKAAIAQGNYDGAIALLNQALKSDPRRARLYGYRAIAYLRKGDYTAGKADLKAAIRHNPNDAGQDYPPPPAIKLSAAALQQGERQVSQMLQDRPAMDQFGEYAGFLRNWAARRFAGEYLGTPIDWSNHPPIDSDAEHLAPDEHSNAAIMVAPIYESGPHRGQPRSFEELWAGAIYELHNVCFAKEFVRLHKEAELGRVSKRDFVAGILKFELRAAQQTRAFYLQCLLPWLEKKKLPTDPTLWFCDWWDSPQRALQSFSDKSAYPWRPYARMHDWATVNRRWRLGKVKNAVGLLEEMRAEKGYEDDEADVCLWIGRCLQRINRPTEAMTAFDESIRLDPENPEAYQDRGNLYQQLGKPDKAQADWKKAQELEAKYKRQP